MGQENGIFKDRHLLLDIPRPLPFGTRLSYVTPLGEVKSGTVVEAGYYTLIVYSSGTISIIAYKDIVSLD